MVTELVSLEQGGQCKRTLLNENCIFYKMIVIRFKVVQCNISFRRRGHLTIFSCFQITIVIHFPVPWIGCWGSTEWPPLPFRPVHCNVFLCGWANEEAYWQNPRTHYDLEENFQTFCIQFYLAFKEKNWFSFLQFQKLYKRRCQCWIWNCIVIFYICNDARIVAIVAI
jgi:hypothetical protein